MSVVFERLFYKVIPPDNNLLDIQRLRDMTSAAADITRDLRIKPNQKKRLKESANNVTTLLDTLTEYSDTRHSEAFGVATTRMFNNANRSAEIFTKVYFNDPVSIEDVNSVIKSKTGMDADDLVDQIVSAQVLLSTEIANAVLDMDADDQGMSKLLKRLSIKIDDADFVDRFNIATRKKVPVPTNVDGLERGIEAVDKLLED